MPSDSQYISGSVPAEMLPEGLEVETTGIPEIDRDGQPAQLTRIRIPRPPEIPAGPPKVIPIAASPMPAAPPPGVLSYDFPLFPGVQARVMLVGENITAEHVAQLCDYLQVACKNIRLQPVVKGKSRKESAAEKGE